MQTDTFERVAASPHSLATRRVVCGVGINDGWYNVCIVKGEKRNCPIYQSWLSMVKRCYSEKVHVRLPNYKEVSMCTEWLHFSSFYSWAITQDYINMELDKDIINSNTKKYSPQNCCFVPKNINSLILVRQRDRGKFPLGVSRRPEGPYRAAVNKNGKRVGLGTFKTPEEASRAYNKAKSQHIREKAQEYYEESNDKRVYEGLLRWAKLFEEGKVA